MAVLSLDPIRDLLTLQDRLERLRRSPATDSIFGPPRATVFPPVNVFTDGDGIVVRAEVPGIAHEKMDVTVEKRRLVISGERGNEPEGVEGAAYHRRERGYGQFRRSLHLPDNLETDAATAECSNGVLTIRIPKQEAAKPRSVPIAAA